MFRADDYVKVSDLAEAYELCQKRSSLVVGGMVWMKMTHITKRTIVDLSGLGLDAIEEKEGEFSIGCMCSLRQLETHEGLNRYFDGIFRECTRNIVGVQMRNCATVGGSIFARFGFSDILTCFLALDTYVELYHEGTIPLSEFAARPVRRDQKDYKERRKKGCLYQSAQFPYRFSGDRLLCFQPWKQMVCVRWGKTCKSKGSDHYRG